MESKLIGVFQRLILLLARERKGLLSQSKPPKRHFPSTIGQKTTSHFTKMCIYIAFTDKVESNYHFLISGWNCMTHLQALQDFSDTNRVSHHKNNKNKKNNLLTSQQFLPRAGEVTVAFNFISERTV
jgi:hypothetical protein